MRRTSLTCDQAAPPQTRPSALSTQTKAVRVIDMGLFVETNSGAEGRLLRWLCHQHGFRFKTGGRKKNGERIFITQKMWAGVMGIRDPKKLSSALSSLRRRGILGNDREPGRDGYAVTEHFLSDDFISWTGLVWDTLWNKDGEYPGLMSVWKRAEQEGQEFYRAEDLIAHYYPERFFLLSAAREGWTQAPTTTHDEVFGVSGETPQNLFGVSGETPQNLFGVSGETPQNLFGVSGETPPKEERVYKENGLTENGTTPAPEAQARRADVVRSYGDYPDSKDEMPEGTFGNSDLPPPPTKVKKTSDVVGTHAWLFARFEAERVKARVGTSRYNHGHLRRVVKSLREDDGMSYAEIEILVRVFFAKDPQSLRSKIADYDLIALFQQQVPQLIIQSKSRIEDRREGRESSAERSARLGAERKARMRESAGRAS